MLTPGDDRLAERRPLPRNEPSQLPHRLRGALERSQPGGALPPLVEPPRATRQYHFPLTTPPKATSPASAMMIARTTCPTSATTIPTTTRMPPTLIPPARA